MACGEPKWWTDMISNNTIKIENNYVCGFLFDKEETGVALVKKNRPSWQKGFLNGVGGKIEFDETPIQAMIREFQEEAGLTITDWQFVIDMSNEFHKISFFKAHCDSFDDIKTMTDEEIIVLDLSELSEYPILPNLQWLIPMMLDKTVLAGKILMQ